MTPDAAATAVVKRFLFAIAIGDGEAVWEELGDHARAHVISIAVQQGMDFELGSRLRLGTATEHERSVYLENLVSGLRRDLEGLDLAGLALHAEVVEPAAAPDRVRVHYAVPLGLALQGGGTRVTSPSIPAGSVIVTRDEGRWSVERLIPRPGP